MKKLTLIFMLAFLFMLFVATPLLVVCQLYNEVQDLNTELAIIRYDYLEMIKTLDIMNKDSRLLKQDVLVLENILIEKDYVKVID